MPESLPEIAKLFNLMIKHQSSDLHLKVDQPPIFRVGGQLSRMQTNAALSQGQLEALLFPLMDESVKEDLQERGNVDFAWGTEELGRYRCNVYFQRGTLSAAIRRVNSHIPSYEELHLPPQISRIPEFEQGLVLIGGITGSGKSTTLAAILNDINNQRRCHILTLEDPIEYQFDDNKAIINQREIGIDVTDFKDALRAAVRQDPDVILVGEMRDAETFETALSAAETGHLVFGTIHSSGCAQTIGRILDLFPEDKHEQIRTSLAFNLRCVINQKLLKSSRPEIARIPADEIMFMTPIIKKAIVEREDQRIAAAIAADKEFGCESFNQVLTRLYRQNMIDHDTALKAAPNAEELKMSMSGISIQDGGIV